MEEICVNDYIRTETKIGKVISIKEKNSKWKYIVKFNHRKTHLAEWCIKKHSPNIIDLIEENDYVNGHRVRCVYLEGTKHYIKLENFDLRVYNEEIKSVVTHEQFNSIKYEVE